MERLRIVGALIQRAGWILALPVILLSLGPLAVQNVNNWRTSSRMEKVTAAFKQAEAEGTNHLYGESVVMSVDGKKVTLYDPLLHVDTKIELGAHWGEGVTCGQIVKLHLACTESQLSARGSTDKRDYYMLEVLSDQKLVVLPEDLTWVLHIAALREKTRDGLEDYVRRQYAETGADTDEPTNSFALPAEAGGMTEPDMMPSRYRGWRRPNKPSPPTEAFQVIPGIISEPTPSEH